MNSLDYTRDVASDDSRFIYMSGLKQFAFLKLGIAQFVHDVNTLYPKYKLPLPISKIFSKMEGLFSGRAYLETMHSVDYHNSDMNRMSTTNANRDMHKPFNKLLNPDVYVYTNFRDIVNGLGGNWPSLNLVFNELGALEMEDEELFEGVFDFVICNISSCNYRAQFELSVLFSMLLLDLSLYKHMKESSLLSPNIHQHIIKVSKGYNISDSLCSINDNRSSSSIADLWGMSDEGTLQIRFGDTAAPIYSIPMDTIFRFEHVLKFIRTSSKAKDVLGEERYNTLISLSNKVLLNGISVPNFDLGRRSSLRVLNYPFVTEDIDDSLSVSKEVIVSGPDFTLGFCDSEDSVNYKCSLFESENLLTHVQDVFHLLRLISLAEAAYYMNTDVIKFENSINKWSNYLSGRAILHDKAYSNSYGDKVAFQTSTVTIVNGKTGECEEVNR